MHTKAKPMSILTNPMMRSDLSLIANICCINSRQKRGDKKGKIPSRTNSNPIVDISIDHIIQAFSPLQKPEIQCLSTFLRLFMTKNSVKLYLWHIKEQMITPLIINFFSSHCLSRIQFSTQFALLWQ